MEPLRQRKPMGKRPRRAGILPSRITLPSLKELEKSILLDSLAEFVKAAWHIVEMSEDLVWNWHHDLICSKLESVSAGKIKRLLINLPPGTTKSLIVSVFWPAWNWAKDPSKRFLKFSYSKDNSLRDNLKVKDVVTSEWFQSRFKITLREDSQPKTHYYTIEGGYQMASSIGGKGTGEHPHFIITDDPIKALDAGYLSAIEEVNSWHSKTISTRRALKPGEVIVMQRMHLLDLSDKVIQTGMWDSLILPMEFIPESRDYKPDPLDIRTKEGELLFPEKYDQETIDVMKMELGPFDAACQLQQAPLMNTGKFFKESYFKYINEDEIPNDCYWCRGWDIAESDEEMGVPYDKQKSDETVGVLMGMSKSTKNVYVRHVHRERSVTVDKSILAFAELDKKIKGTGYSIREGSGSGKSTIAARRRLLHGYDFAPSPETGQSKTQRAKPFRAQCEGGNVYVVRDNAPPGEGWNRLYIYAMCGFLILPHDDDVDASSNAYNCLVETKPKPQGVILPKKKPDTKRIISRLA